MKRYVLLLFIALFTATGIAFAQNGKIVTGKLLDEQTKDPLIGATVTVKGTKVAAAAGLEWFALTVCSPLPRRKTP